MTVDERRWKKDSNIGYNCCCSTTKKPVWHKKLLLFNNKDTSSTQEIYTETEILKTF